METSSARSGFFGTTLAGRELAGLRLVERRYAPDQRTPRHSHERAYVGLVLEGFSLQVSGARTLERGPMTAFLYPPGETQSEQFGAGGGRVFSVELDDALFARLDPTAAARAGAVDSRGGPLAWLAAKLYGEFRRPDDVSELAIEGLVLEILAEATRRARPDRGPRAPVWLERARDMLHARFAERVSLGEIAGAVGVHPVYLSAEFRKRYGATVGDYVRRLRVEFACRRLATSDAPLAAVALAEFTPNVMRARPCGMRPRCESVRSRDQRSHFSA